MMAKRKVINKFKHLGKRTSSKSSKRLHTLITEVSANADEKVEIIITGFKKEAISSVHEEVSCFPQWYQEDW